MIILASPNVNKKLIINHQHELPKVTLWLWGLPQMSSCSTKTTPPPKWTTRFLLYLYRSTRTYEVCLVGLPQKSEICLGALVHTSKYQVLPGRFTAKNRDLSRNPSIQSRLHSCTAAQSSDTDRRPSVRSAKGCCHAWARRTALII